MSKHLFELAVIYTFQCNYYIWQFIYFTLTCTETLGLTGQKFNAWTAEFPDYMFWTSLDPGGLELYSDPTSSGRDVSVALVDSRSHFVLVFLLVTDSGVIRGQFSDAACYHFFFQNICYEYQIGLCNIRNSWLSASGAYADPLTLFLSYNFSCKKLLTYFFRESLSF